VSETAEQRRARFALERAKSVEPRGKKVRAKFRTQLLKLPARLHTNGLGQAAAYLRAQKESSAEREIYQWLADWLKESGRYQTNQLLNEIVGGGNAGTAAPTPASNDPNVEANDPPDVAGQYRAASAEARRLASWLKRFAEAFLAEIEEPNTDDSGTAGTIVESANAAEPVADGTHEPVATP